MERTSFIFYKSFYEAVKELPRETQGETLAAIIEYGLTGVRPDVQNPVSRAILSLVCPMIDANNQHYINGRKGGRPRNPQKPQPIENEYNAENLKNQTETETKPNANQTETETKPNGNSNVYVNVNENVNENVSVYENEKSASPDTHINFDSIVWEFFRNNRKNPIGEARRFWDYYASQNWCKSNGAKLSSMTSAVRMWKCQGEGVRFEPNIQAFLVAVLMCVAEAERVPMIESLRSAKVQGGVFVLACSYSMTEIIESHADELQPIFRQNLGNVELKYQIVK